MMIATHEMGFAREFADQVCYLEDGRIVERGPPEQIFSEPAQPATQRFLARLLVGGARVDGGGVAHAAGAGARGGVRRGRPGLRLAATPRWTRPPTSRSARFPRPAGARRRRRTASGR